jgi:adenine-specific DNA methylase
MEDKRLIEVDFPLKEVSEESVREKNIRHGHISTLHIWWARRPLAASRATTFAALIPAPKSEEKLKELKDFIAELCKWENSLNQELIEKARKMILSANGGEPPRVLDPFAGGGAIPLETLRLGCETYALEYNPVAVLILKAVLEFPQKYREKVGGEEILKLVYDVKKWGEWVLGEVKKEIGQFYPEEEEISDQRELKIGKATKEKCIPVGYIWARTIRCQNPSCGAEIPLMRQFWLAKKENRKIALKPIVDRENKKIEFKIVEDGEIDFDPSVGTTRRATVQCPVCGAGIDDNTVRRLFQEGKASQRMIAIILHKPEQVGRVGRVYRIATKDDVKIFKQAEEYLQRKIEELREKWGVEPIPNEFLPPKETLGFRVQRYGILKWGDLFNSRQKLTLITFVDKVRETYYRMINEGYDEEYARAVVTYLALILSSVSNYSSILQRWVTNWEVVAATFSRQALPMVWDYVELNGVTMRQGWPVVLDWVQAILQHLLETFGTYPIISQASATELPFSPEYFDAVITDPPYYDNVPYSYLSDFFYVWLKRTIGDFYPDLFATPLTPKSKEIVAYTHDKSWKEAKRFFEEMLTQAFKEIHRVLKPNGIAVIVFAHRSTDAWEAIINSLLKSGLILTASWPIHTEMKVRLRAKESAALASSVYMICRKYEKKPIAYFNEIKEELERRVKERLDYFWNQNIRGADFFVSAIGPAVEVFGKYEKVEKLSGEEVSVQELLEYVRKIVSEYALERVLKTPNLGGVDTETRFYLLWRWMFGNAKVRFDDAIKLSRPLGVELTSLWDGGFVKKEKEFVRVLNPIERVKDKTFMRRKPTTMIDVLHRCLILWEKGSREQIKELLNETGYAKNEMFWQTAQAIAEVLPEGDKEKQLIQGLLYGKDTYTKEDRKELSLLDFMEE